MTGKNVPNLCRIPVVASIHDRYFLDDVAGLSLEVHWSQGTLFESLRIRKP
jgi:hypothetical protein